MTKRKKLLIAAGGVLLAALASLLLFLFLGGKDTPQVSETPENTQQQAPDPTSGVQPAPDRPEDTQPAVTTPPPADLPASVVIPGNTKDNTLSFPCTVPGHQLMIEKLAPYTGLFVEDGSNTQRADVAMILIRNQGEKPLEYAQIAVNYEGETLEFQLSALPAGAAAVVQERNGKAVPGSQALEAKVLAVQRAEMSVADQLSVTDNGDNSLTVENRTDTIIPSARIFYKYHMDAEDVYVGGISFTVKLDALPAGEKTVIRPSHFRSGTSRVVMAQVYDTVE